MKRFLVSLLVSCIFLSADCQESTPTWLQAIANEYVGENASVEHWGVVADGKPYTILNPESQLVVIDVKYKGLTNHVWLTGTHNSNSFSALVPVDDDHNPVVGLDCKHSCAGKNCSSCKLTIAGDDPCTGGCNCKVEGTGTGNGQCDHTVSQ